MKKFIGMILFVLLVTSPLIYKAYQEAKDLQKFYTTEVGQKIHELDVAGYRYVPEGTIALEENGKIVYLTGEGTIRSDKFPEYYKFTASATIYYFPKLSDGRDVAERQYLLSLYSKGEKAPHDWKQFVQYAE